MAYIPPGSTPQEILAIMNNMKTANTSGGTTITNALASQASGITPQTTGGFVMGSGQPLSTFTPQQMNQPGFVRTGATTGYMDQGVTQAAQQQETLFNGMPYSQWKALTEAQVAQQRATIPQTRSNSDAFFASANAPIASRTVTSPNISAAIQSVKPRQNYAAASLIAKALADAKAGSEAANKENIARYEEAKKEIAGVGQAQTQGIEEEYTKDLARQEQDAVSRGLGNTTIRESLRAGAGTRRQTNLLNLRDRLAQARIALLQSREDNALNPLSLAQLAMQAAQYSG